MSTLAERLKQERKASNLTQDRLAKKTGSTQAVIQKIENGKSLRPRNLEKLAETLSVRCGWLMYGELPKTETEHRLMVEICGGQQ